jgi:hypothetical protein
MTSRGRGVKSRIRRCKDDMLSINIKVDFIVMLKLKNFQSQTVPVMITIDNGIVYMATLFCMLETGCSRQKRSAFLQTQKLSSMSGAEGAKVVVIHILRSHVHDCDTLPKRKARALINNKSMSNTCLSWDSGTFVQ